MSDVINIDITEYCDNIVVNISECGGGGGGSDVELLQIIGTNTTSYTNSNLVSKSILLVFIDAQKMSTSTFTFDAITGNINFISVIDTGAEIDIIYK
jgi:hypothetical protein